MSIRIEKASSQIIVVDIQQKLAPHLHAADFMIQQVEKLLKAAQIFNIPMTIAEQYPKGLGKSIDELSPFINNNVFSKTSFSCFGNEAITSVLCEKQQNSMNTLIVIGCEAHVCVLQTVIDALDKGFRVIVVADAVASRTFSDKELAKERLSKAGAEYVSTEMLLFEWTQSKDADEFKQISSLVK